MKQSIVQLTQSMKVAHNAFAELSSQERKDLETAWDLEHAYYSSALEGSTLDRKDVEDLVGGV